MKILYNANPIRLLTAVFFLTMLALPLSAQEKEDSVYIFRFLPKRNMFYAPGLNNGEELARIFESVDRCKDSIMAHEIYLYVDGFYNATGKKADRYQTARTRSNRVKSELITRKGLKEDNFITRNHAATSNYVTVRFRPKGWVPNEPIDLEPVDIEQLEIESDTVIADPQAVEDITICQPEETVSAIDSVENSALQDSRDSRNSLETPENPEATDASDSNGITAQTDTATSDAAKADSRFALKTNLLGYAVLMPNIEGEWKFADRWSVALEVQGAWYAKENPHKAYRLSTVTPEVRYWAINRSRWNGMYVGLFGGWGLYDLSKGGDGHEGEGEMAGLSLGYMWPISKHLSLDAGIGVGYMHARDKKYAPRDNHYLYQYTKDINYFGPLRLKLSLVWRIPQ